MFHKTDRDIFAKDSNKCSNTFTITPKKQNCSRQTNIKRDMERRNFSRSNHRLSFPPTPIENPSRVEWSSGEQTIKRGPREERLKKFDQPQRILRWAKSSSLGWRLKSFSSRYIKVVGRLMASFFLGREASCASCPLFVSSSFLIQPANTVSSFLTRLPISRPVVVAQIF